MPHRADEGGARIERVAMRITELDDARRERGR
jgi:hypothetical protein